MGIYKLINDLKLEALNIPTCFDASFGDITLYDNKKTVLYPYINIDVVNNNVINNSVKKYTLRIYVLDRNEPYIAYNKCELILKTYLNSLQIENYIINYFTLDFKDLVNGVFADINYEVGLVLNCVPYQDMGYILLENGDFVAKNLLTEIGGRFEIDN